MQSLHTGVAFKHYPMPVVQTASF